MKKKEDEFEKIKKERDEFLDGWRRAKAELLNTKKEMTENLGKFSERVEMEFAEDFLPVIDALEAAEGSDIEGLVPIKKLMDSILKGRHIEEILPKNGDEFDPRYHEAVSGKGHIISSCRQKGYMYRSRVIRPAIVEVKEK